jgi:hypothetical protein
MGLPAGAALGGGAAGVTGVYRPRRPRASPLFRLLDDHFHYLATV